MGALDGRTALITGAGRGIGRQHALLFASEGAKVVVNDLGGSGAGEGSDAGPAQAVVDEITAAGGKAVANTDDVSSWEGAEALIGAAIEAFGGVDVVVNNAGILRDRFIAQMEESEWDAVIKVHLKGHFCVLRHAAAHWRRRSKEGEAVSASVINTASGSGTFLPNPGQANYGAAKAGIAAMTLVAAAELERYGVRVNGIAPVARTRLTADVPGVGELMKAPDDPDAFDPFDPKHVSPFVAFLATESCSITGRVFAVQGGSISELVNWQTGETITSDGDWTIESIAKQLATAATA